LATTGLQECGRFLRLSLGNSAGLEWPRSHLEFSPVNAAEGLYPNETYSKTRVYCPLLMVAESGKQMLTIQYSIARLSRRPAPCFLGLRSLCHRITRDKPNCVRPWAKIMSPPTSRSRRGWLYADTSLPRYFRRSPLRMSMSAASPQHSSNISAFEFALQWRGYYCLSKR
jgi:hypothetical protein